MNYSEYLRMRNNRKIAQSTSKSIAIKGYDDDLETVLVKKVDSICNAYNLERRSSKEMIRVLLTEGISEEKVTRRIDYIYNVLENYGYNESKREILESNKSLLMHTSSDLVHTLAITSMYGLDREILTIPTVYSRIDDKTIYALIEELKEQGLDVTMENIQSLYINLSNKELLYELRQKYPLTKKVIFSYVFTNDKVLSKSKGVK